jgi:hypothetical protein
MDIFEVIDQSRWRVKTVPHDMVAAVRMEKMLRDVHNKDLDRIAEAIKSEEPENIFSADQLSDWADRNGYTRDEAEYK